MRVLRLPKWALIWAQGLYIESWPTSPKAYVAGDIAVFWRERNGPKPKNWVEGLGRPTSHLPAHFTQLPPFSHLLVLSNISSFSSSKGIIHLSPSGLWVGPYNIKSLGPFGRPTLKYNFQFGLYKWAYGLYIARPTLRPTLQSRTNVKAHFKSRWAQLQMGPNIKWS
jgi:hypothetical protein